MKFWSGLIPVNRGGWIYSTLTAISPISTLHLARFMASSFSKPTLLLSFVTCVFHVLFGCPCFLFPFTSNLHLFSQIMLIIPPQHMPPSSHSIRPSVLFFSISFTPHDEVSPTFLCKHFWRILIFILHKIFYPTKSFIFITRGILLYEICKENWDADKLPVVEKVNEYWCRGEGCEGTGFIIMDFKAVTSMYVIELCFTPS